MGWARNGPWHEMGLYGMKWDGHEIGQTQNGMGTKWDGHEMGLPGTKWDGHEMGRARNGTLGHEMGWARNGPSRNGGNPFSFIFSFLT